VPLDTVDFVHVEESQATGKRKLKPPKKVAAKKTRKKKAASSKNK
jgi:hypothetical protein